MKILVLPRRRAGVAVEAFQPHVTAEIQAVWDLYAQGICREFYARADQPGTTPRNRGRVHGVATWFDFGGRPRRLGGTQAGGGT